jgi:predicted unusual protein kinase regulating ubiquinone biosynthesis (AarF/ABC1/UbiB family)
MAINYSSIEHQHFVIPYDASELPVVHGFTTTNCKVIGSGMIAIVFEAVENENVYIIKAKRNGIDQKLRQGLSQVKTIMDWLCYIPYVNSFNLRYVFEDIQETMLQQLNFEDEVKNHKKFKEMFAGNEQIVIPDLFEDRCTSTQIVMSKLDGNHYHATMTQREEYSKLIMNMVVKGLVMDGIIHADLHAGNIIFMNNKIGIIDFGLMLKFQKEEHANFMKIIKHVVLHECEQAFEKIFSTVIEPEDRKQQLTHAQKEELKQNLIAIYYNATAVNKCFSSTDICKVIQQLHKYNLYLYIVFYKLVMTISASEMMLRQLTPQSSALFIEYAKELLTQ